MALFFTALSLIPFYIIGTFPTGLLIAKSAGVDITKTGSGNVGATNVARTLGKKAGILTLLGDILKGVLAVIAASLVSDDPSYKACAATAVVCGHCFSLPPLLKGGKGVATSLGAILALSPWLAFCGVTIFAGLFWLTRYVSLASVSAALVIPIISLVSGMPDYLTLSLVPVALIVVFRHRENLDRLVKGTEPKFTSKAKS